MHQCRIAQCVWPQSCVHCRRPSLACMQELLLGALREVPDGTLGNSILKMRIDTAEGELQLVLLACLLECIVCKLMMVMPCSAANCSNASFAFIVSSDDKFCIRCTYRRREKWLTKMDAARYRLEVSLPFSWAKIPLVLISCD
jgi:hypothetical protein